MMCDIPECKKMNFSKVKIGNEVIMRLCAEHTLSFSECTIDVPGLKSARQAAKHALYDDWRAEIEV